MRTLLLLVLLCPSVWAALGGTITSIEQDQKALHGALKIMRADDYSVSEISVDGTKVREYALGTGTVFAVAWRGVAQPDLSVLLGDYYEEYESALEAEPDAPRSRGPRSLHSKHMVVEKFGHMRDVHGKAYVPSLVPEGFRLEDIK